MIKELDTIVLSHDVEAYGLKQGDIGAVVHVYKDGAAYEVEFAQDIRPMNEYEILHVRELVAL